MADVTTKHAKYEDLLVDVEKNTDAVKGERAVKDKTTKYLPPLASMLAYDIQDDIGNTITKVGAALTHEGRIAYNKYISLAYFYGATGRTVDGLTGLIFSKQALQELPTQLEYIKSNVDSKGTSLRNLANSAVKQAFITPLSGVLADFPRVKSRVSVLDAENMNLRPKILHYGFTSIINYNFESINNVETLTLLVLREQQKIKVDRFEFKCRTVYRVLELIEGVYYQSLLNDKSEEIEPQEVVLVNGAPSNEIPFYFISAGSEDKAVINDLVDANFNHYRFFADYAAKEHASAFPVFYETGIQGEDNNMLIGVGAKWSTANTDATFGVLQTASDGGSMRQYLLDMEQRMAALGAEMLKPRIAGVQSAEAKSLDQVAQNSTVASIAIEVSEALEKALRFCAKWLGLDESSVTYSLNTDYNPTGMDANKLNALFATYQGGGISYQTFYENLQRGEIASNDRTAEEEQALAVNQELGL